MVTGEDGRRRWWRRYGVLGTWRARVWCQPRDFVSRVACATSSTGDLSVCTYLSVCTRHSLRRGTHCGHRAPFMAACDPQARKDKVTLDW